MTSSGCCLGCCRRVEVHEPCAPKWAGERTATALRDAVAATPDATLVELCATMRDEHGVDVDVSTMSVDG